MDTNDFKRTFALSQRITPKSSSTEALLLTFQTAEHGTFVVPMQVQEDGDLLFGRCKQVHQDTFSFVKPINRYLIAAANSPLFLLDSVTGEKQVLNLFNNNFMFDQSKPDQLILMNSDNFARVVVKVLDLHSRKEVDSFEYQLNSERSRLCKSHSHSRVTAYGGHIFEFTTVCPMRGYAMIAVWDQSDLVRIKVRRLPELFQDVSNHMCQSGNMLLIYNKHEGVLINLHEVTDGSNESEVRYKTLDFNALTFDLRKTVENITMQISGCFLVAIVQYPI